MSGDTKRKLEVAGLTIAIISGLAGIFGAFVLLPYRMDAAEKDITTIRVERATDHEMLVRIDERAAATKAQLDRLEAKLDRMAK